MNSYNQRKPRTALTPTALLILGAVLTVGIIMGIKFLVGGDANESLPPSAARENIFKDERAVAPGLPGSRSEAPGGDSLELFTKANEGYSEEDSTPTAAAKPAARGAAIKAAVAATSKMRAKDQGKPRQTTVIPRLQGVKPFGTAAPDSKLSGN